MELKNLNDFYEKQEYYSYDELHEQESHLTTRVHELTFCLNVASFSVIMAMMVYRFITMTSSLVAVPAALVVGFIVFLVCKKGIKKIVHLLMK